MAADAQIIDSPTVRPLLALLQHRFVILLGALGFLLLAAPLALDLGPAAHPEYARIVMTLIFVVTLLSAMLAACQSRLTVLIAVSLAVPAVAVKAVSLAVDRPAVQLLEHLLGMLLLGYVMLVLLRYLFVQDRVTVNTISASLCVYLLLGVWWAITYSLMEQLHPGSFAVSIAQEGERGVMHFGSEQSVFPLYFSFVTMSTLGFGDIVPTSMPARMFAAVEAIMGQLYLVVLVARLVGLHISHSATAPNGDGVTQT